jgi:hypothetical protein
MFSDANVIPEPFVCMGFATYESHEGERPMAGPFRGWRLEREIPAGWMPVMALAVPGGLEPLT